MKITRKTKNEHIITPWLNTQEAAIFLGISDETFRQLNRIIRCPSTPGGTHHKRYHSDVLTAWLEKIAEHHEEQQPKTRPAPSTPSATGKDPL